MLVSGEEKRNDQAGTYHVLKKTMNVLRICSHCLAVRRVILFSCAGSALLVLEPEASLTAGTSSAGSLSRTELVVDILASPYVLLATAGAMSTWILRRRG